MLNTPLKPFRMSQSELQVTRFVLTSWKKSRVPNSTLSLQEEVTHASNKEELSLVIQYVHKGQIREVFVDFVEVERIT